MARFTVGDWVRITPTADPNWEFWNASMHPHFLDKVGEIMDIVPNPANPTEFHIQVKCLLWDNSGGKTYFKEWWKDDHLIMTTKREADTILYSQDVSRENTKRINEFNEWEKNHRKRVADVFKDMLGIEPPKPVELDVPEPVELTEEELKEFEDMTTLPIALPGARVFDTFDDDDLDAISDMFGDPS